MSGNVCELCEDRYQSSYSGAPTDGSAWTNNKNVERVYRGGDINTYATNLRSAERSKVSPDGSSNSLGFRVAYNP